MCSTQWAVSNIRLIAIFLIFGLFAGVAQPAFAQSEPVASGVGVCNRLPDRLIEQDVTWIRSRLGEAFPAKQTDLLARIEIKEDPEDRFLGPVIEDHETIVLPRAFMRRLCHQILLQTVYINRDDDAPGPGSVGAPQQRSDSAKFIRENQACLKEGLTTPQCLDRGILSYLRSQTDRANGNSIDLNDETPITLAYGTAEFLIVHEARHAIAVATPTKIQSGALVDQEEAEADLFAQQHLFAQQNMPLGPLMAMATMSLFEQDQTQDDATHPSAACRYRQFRSVLKTSGPVYFTVVDFFAKYQKFEEENEATEFIKDIMNIPLLVNASKNQKCEYGNNPYVELAAAEIDSYFSPLFSELKKSYIESSDDLNDLEDSKVQKQIQKLTAGFVRKFQSRRWKSPAAQKIAAKYVYAMATMSDLTESRIEKMSEKFDEIDDDSDSGMIGAIKSMEPIFDKTEKLYRMIGKQFFAPEERMMFEHAPNMLRFLKQLTPAILRNPTKVAAMGKKNNKDIDAVLSRYTIDLPAYFYSHAYFNALAPSLANAYFPRYNQMAQLANGYIQTEVYFGNCGDANFRAKAMIGRILSRFPKGRQFDKSMCEQFKKSAAEAYETLAPFVVIDAVETN